MSSNSKIYSALTMLKTLLNYLNLSTSFFKSLQMQIEFCNPNVRNLLFRKQQVVATVPGLKLGSKMHLHGSKTCCSHVMG